MTRGTRTSRRRPICLASGSPARRELLKFFGLKFKVVPSRALEDTRARGTAYAALAVGNARRKAEDVAGRVRHGLVIAADTIVVQGRRVSGKPKDLCEARAMLKRLSARPHSLYTGLVVIDKDTGRRYEDVERTRVFMDPLNDKQISDYFSGTSPLDKAGGFDIQGRGAFFIRRIEGCYYNVVGLPVRKLYRLLLRAGVKLALGAACAAAFASAGFSLGGCSTEYNIVTGSEEKYLYGTDKEVAMGTAIARRIDREKKLADDPLVQERVDSIGRKIAAVSDRCDISYTFKVLDEEEVNAVSLPGGFVYVNKGLIERVSSDDELAGVLAHEVGHIVARHSIKRLQGMQGYAVLRALLAAAPVPGGAETGVAADAAFTELLLGYSREDELLADQLGARYAARAGFDPRGMIYFLTKLQELDRRKPARPTGYFRTHPYVPDRIRVTKQEIGEKMDFTDYINIQDQPHGVNRSGGGE